MKGKRFERPLEVARCRFCKEKQTEVDYKDVAVLQKYVTAQGALHSRKRSGNCARHQRSTKTAVKRARFMALLGYLG